MDKRIFYGVKCDHFCEEENRWYIDGWIDDSDDDGNDGTVGYVDGTSGNIYYKSKNAENDPLVREVATAKQSEVRANKPKMWCVTYVGLSDSEYKANGYSEVVLYATKDAAKAKLKAWRDNEIADLKEQGRDYEILEDKDDECRIGWCGYGEQIRIEIHEVELNK